ncbi:hypothetical protein BJV78DRAFT_396611 [Lactifluus subvellereus]|nr:hypothetical protein BJV78DRAFT_396611 [Lactifluus subvellereus]
MGIAVSRHDGQKDQPQGIATGLPVTPYTSFENGFISTIVAAAFLSALSVIFLFLLNILRPPSRLGDRTNIPIIFGSLITSNLLQSIGTLFNTRWVLHGGVSSGTLCSLQGGIKQAGNVGTAVWSFALALHAFHLLFLRSRVSKVNKWLTLALGWTFIVFVVSIGPLAIQRKAVGPYFGPSGFWCWITVQYPAAQTFLEYMLEWTSAFFSFVLYMIVLLRVRGNLLQDSKGKWFLRWVSRGESWQLSFARDYLDSCTVKMAAIIVWYPVIYTVLIVPISIARFASYAGARVPPTFTFLADIVFALGGFANLLLFIGTRRFIPDINTVPDFSTPRSRLDKDSPRAFGLTPFLLMPNDAEDSLPKVPVVSDGDVSVSWSEEEKTELG